MLPKVTFRRASAVNNQTHAHRKTKRGLNRGRPRSGTRGNGRRVPRRHASRRGTKKRLRRAASSPAAGIGGHGAGGACNRLTAWHLGRCLKRRFKARAEGKLFGLLGGVRTSLTSDPVAETRCRDPTHTPAPHQIKGERGGRPRQPENQNSVRCAAVVSWSVAARCCVTRGSITAWRTRGLTEAAVEALTFRVGRRTRSR